MSNADVPRVSSTIAETRANLSRLDRRDWWRWGTVVTVTLLLTVGVLGLSTPSLRRSFAEQSELDIGVTGLLAIVLLFDVFAVYQQIVISRLRHDLTKQVAVSATLEMLKPVEPRIATGKMRVRNFPRYHLDQRVSVRATLAGKTTTLLGRTSDISEGGVGIVIPESLDVGTEVQVEVGMGSGVVTASAVVRHRRGFHHGLEFLELAPAQGEQIRRACAGAVPVVDLAREFEAAAMRKRSATPS